MAGLSNGKVTFGDVHNRNNLFLNRQFNYVVSIMNNDLNYQMLRIRRIEEALADDYKHLNIRCPMHLSIGQEAIAVGVCENLRKTDKVFSSHRAHAHYLAKGGSLPKLVAELYGRSEGCCGGAGGSMHLTDLEAGFVASTAIVGGIVPVAVGCSWADKLSGNDNVTVVFFGDGCMEEGVMHESFNFATLHRLPIAFVCEHNNLAVTTPIQDRQNNRGLHTIAASHGLGWTNCNGQDVDAVSKAALVVIELARQGKPQFLQCFTERQRVHCGIEHEYTLQNDPLFGYTTDESEITREIEDAFEFAIQSPVPTNVRGVYAKS